MTPQENNAQNYCKDCQRRYSTRSSYNTYLKSVMHKDRLTLAGDVPDRPDSSICWMVCGKAFQFLGNDWQHLIRYHGMELSAPLKITTESIIIHNSNYTSNHCDSCNWTFPSKQNYRRHMQAAHEMIVPRLKAKQDPNISPDINDPNYHCRSCLVSYKNLYGYRQHLKKVTKWNCNHLWSSLFTIQRFLSMIQKIQAMQVAQYLNWNTPASMLIDSTWNLCIKMVKIYLSEVD